LGLAFFRFYRRCYADFFWLVIQGIEILKTGGLSALIGLAVFGRMLGGKIGLEIFSGCFGSKVFQLGRIEGFSRDWIFRIFRGIGSLGFFVGLDLQGFFAGLDLRFCRIRFNGMVIKDIYLFFKGLGGGFSKDVFSIALH
jgi:hypothetical protein